MAADAGPVDLAEEVRTVGDEGGIVAAGVFEVAVAL
jgi:hypothetical protein